MFEYETGAGKAITYTREDVSKKAEPGTRPRYFFTLCDRPDSSAVIGRPHGAAFRRTPEALLCGFAVDFYFDIVVKIVGAVAVAVEADITSLGAFGVDQLTLVGLYVVHIGADAEAR